MIRQITEFFFDLGHEYSIGGHKGFRVVVGVVDGHAERTEYFAYQ